MLYLEEPSPLFTAKLQSILYTLLLSLLLLLLLLLLPLPFIHCPHIHMLPHSRLPTHTLCTLRTYTSHTALLLQWQLQIRETMRTMSQVWRYLGFPLSYIYYIYWVIFCLSFQLTEYISYCYIMMLMNVLNLTMKCGTKVRYYIALKSSLKMA